MWPGYDEEAALYGEYADESLTSGTYEICSGNTLVDGLGFQRNLDAYGNCESISFGYFDDPAYDQARITLIIRREA